MRGENLSEELKANIVFEHERCGVGALRIANKFGLETATVTCFLNRYRNELKDEVADDFEVGEWREVMMPDEGLQSNEEKIIFYKAEAEKYKKLAKELEKKLGFLRKERRAFEAKEIENIVNNRKITEVDGKWKMSHDEFLEFFNELGEI